MTSSTTSSSPQPALELLSDADRAATALHPMRSRILHALGQPNSAAGVARLLALPRQKVNYHLKQLEDGRLVELVEERRAGNLVERVYRATAHGYLIAPSALGKAAASPERVGDRLSSAYLAAVAAQAIQALALLRPAAAKAGKMVPTMTLETEVRFAGPQQQQAFAKHLAQAMREAVARYHSAAAPRGRRFRFFIGGYPAVPRTGSGKEAS